MINHRVNLYFNFYCVTFDFVEKFQVKSNKNFDSVSQNQKTH